VHKETTTYSLTSISDKQDPNEKYPTDYDCCDSSAKHKNSKELKVNDAT
jgi:hypothetical protein